VGGNGEIVEMEMETGSGNHGAMFARDKPRTRQEIFSSGRFDWKLKVVAAKSLGIGYMFRS